MAYAHYFLHTSTPTLAVRAELGAYPTYIPGIARLANYMSYLCSQDAPPLVSKAILVHKAMALKSKFAWWNNAWRILNHVSVTSRQHPAPPPRHHGGTSWQIPYLVAHPNKPYPLPQTIHLPSIPPVIPSSPVPQQWSPLPPSASLTISLLQPPPGHRTRPAYQHSQTTTSLPLLH